LPFRRGELPDQLVEVPGVLAVSKPPAFGREIELIPPLELSRRWQRLLVRFLATDQVATHGYERPAALGPERGDDVGTSRPPIEARNDRTVDFEGIHQRNGVEHEGGWLAVSKRLARQKARRAIAAQVGDDHPVASRSQTRGDVDETVDVVRPPVQQDRGRAAAGTGLGVSDIENAGIDVLERTERAIRGSYSRRRRLRDGAHGLFRTPAPATGFATAWSAWRITSVTACGCETMITW